MFPVFSRIAFRHPTRIGHNLVCFYRHSRIGAFPKKLHGYSSSPATFRPNPHNLLSLPIHSRTLIMRLSPRRVRAEEFRGIAGIGQAGRGNRGWFPERHIYTDEYWQDIHKIINLSRDTLSESSGVGRPSCCPGMLLTMLPLNCPFRQCQRAMRWEEEYLIFLVLRLKPAACWFPSSPLAAIQARRGGALFRQRLCQSLCSPRCRCRNRHFPRGKVRAIPPSVPR